MKQDQNPASPAVQISQRFRIRQQLLMLSPDVTPQDRSLCMEKLKISKATACAYLKGVVSNNDLALKMILFYSSRIDERELKLANYVISRSKAGKNGKNAVKGTPPATRGRAVKA